MNTTSKILVCALCVGAACSGLHAEENEAAPADTAPAEAAPAEATPAEVTLEKAPAVNRWRFSIGPIFGNGLKSSLHVSPQKIPVYSAPSGSLTKSEAERKNNAVGSSRVELGGGYYIDPEDSAGFPGESWNYHLPAESIDAQNHSFDIVSTYVQVTDIDRPISFSENDEESDRGVSFMLEREVYRHGSFGIDIGGMVSWMVCDEAFKASGSGGGQIVETGSYIAKIGIEEDVDIDDPFFVNPDGSYGYGSFDGPGYPLILDEANITREWIPGSRREINRMHISMKGDYREVELALLVRPWYDFTSWLRAVGTLGVGVSNARFSLTTDIAINGAGAEHLSEKFDEWDVYGIAGLGLMARYADFCLGFDCLTKFGEDELEVDARNAQGSLERDNVALRVYLGYEF